MSGKSSVCTLHRRMVAGAPWVGPTALVAVLGCISTDLPTSDAARPCAARMNQSTAPDAVVQVRADLKPGVLRCSGVAIAPTLVVTALGCVVRPAALGDPVPSGPSETRGRLPNIYPASVPYDQVCRREGTWSAREDGSFSARLGKPIAAADILVRRSGDDRVWAAKEVANSGAGSRCADGIAVLTLERQLDVTPLPVRFEETSAVDELVTLSGHCVSGKTVRPRQVPSRIQAVTTDVGTEAAPPRALALQRTVSSFDFGGAVFSPDSGALLGVIASGSEESCDDQDPEGASIAIRLAPFRRMLLEVARGAGEALHSELRADPGSGEPPIPCLNASALSGAR